MKKKNLLSVLTGSLLCSVVIMGSGTVWAKHSANVAPPHQFKRCQELLDQIKAGEFARLGQQPLTQAQVSSPSALRMNRLPMAFFPDKKLLRLATQLHDCDHRGMDEEAIAELEQRQQREHRFLQLCNRATEAEVTQTMRLAQLSYEFAKLKKIPRSEGERKVDLTDPTMAKIRQTLAAQKLRLLEAYGDGFADVQGEKKTFYDYLLGIAGFKSNMGLSGYIAEDPQHKVFYVTMAGTNDFYDGLADLNLGGPQIDSFAAEQMIQDAIHLILQRSAQGQETKLIFSGHSLGGISGVIAHEVDKRIKMQVQAGRLAANRLYYSIDTIGFNSIGPLNHIERQELRRGTVLSDPYELQSPLSVDPSMEVPDELEEELSDITAITLSTPSDIVIRGGGQIAHDNLVVRVPPGTHNQDRMVQHLLWSHRLSTLSELGVDKKSGQRLQPVDSAEIEPIGLAGIVASWFNWASFSDARYTQKSDSYARAFQTAFPDRPYIGPTGQAFNLPKSLGIPGRE